MTVPRSCRLNQLAMVPMFDDQPVAWANPLMVMRMKKACDDDDKPKPMFTATEIAMPVSIMTRGPARVPAEPAMN